MAFGRFNPPSWKQQSTPAAAPVSVAAGQNNYTAPVTRAAVPPPNDDLAAQIPSAAQNRSQEPAQQTPATPPASSIPSPPSPPSNYAAPANRVPQQDVPSPVPSGNAQVNPSDYISQKIHKINGKDKVVDFNSRLVMANIQDFANLHGCGGTGHAINSTINLTLCDYTRGTGDKSVTVKYSVDVEDMSLLYWAAMDARLGNLAPSPSHALPLLDSMITQIHSWTGFPVTPNKERIIPGQAINAILNAAIGVRSSIQATKTAPVFSYAREKVHSHPKALDANGFAPVTKIQINYTPLRPDGEPSRYPWYLYIENFSAPLAKQSTGGTTYDGSKATNKRSAFINVSTDDFAAAMVAVDRFITVWQMRCLPMMNEAYRRIDAMRNTEKAKASEEVFAVSAVQDIRQAS